MPIYSKRNMPMLGVSEEELKRDRERLMNFIKENPYPDYKFIEYDLLLKQEQSLEIRRVWRDKPRSYERNL